MSDQLRLWLVLDFPHGFTFIVCAATAERAVESVSDDVDKTNVRVIELPTSEEAVLWCFDRMARSGSVHWKRESSS